jgi:hypothetical protein
MATFTKAKLSGSTDGKQIKVVQTATAGTTIHTADATALDEIWLWAYNSDTADRELTIEWGEATAPDGNIKVTIPFKTGYVLVIPGLLLTNSAVVKAFAASANVIMINGYVNRIT